MGAIAGGESASLGRKVIAATAGGATIVVGYFVFEAFVYPAIGRVIPAFAITDVAAAIVEIIPNAVQAVIGAAGGIALWRAVAGVKMGR